MWILQSGVCRIVQRNWRDDIDDPKSKTRKRPLTLGYLVERYRLQAAAERAHAEKWVFTQAGGSGRGLRFARSRSALFPARQYRVAAGGRRVEHRSVEDRRPQHDPDDRGIHEDST